MTPYQKTIGLGCFGVGLAIHLTFISAFTQALGGVLILLGLYVLLDPKNQP